MTSETVAAETLENFDCTPATPDTRQCNHQTNGSFSAFIEGFRSVTGREPEPWVDYYGCCLALSEGWLDSEGETLTEEQLGECRVIGEEAGREALADADVWKKLKLCRREIEAVVRWLVSLELDHWWDAHNNAFQASSRSRAMWASRRLNYFADVLGPRLDEVECEVWRERIGGWVKNCSCSQCCRMRPRLFPELEPELDRQLQEPAWQSVVTEIRRQFPRLPVGKLPGLVKTAIHRGAPNEPAAAAARQIVETHARSEMERDIDTYLNAPEGECTQYWSEQIGPLLEEWRAAGCEPLEIWSAVAGGGW